MFAASDSHYSSALKQTPKIQIGLVEKHEIIIYELSVRF